MFKTSKIWTKPGLSILWAALIVLAPSVVLADFDVTKYDFAPDAYKDLPGVKSQEDLAKLREDYTCESTLLRTRNPDGRYLDIFGRNGLPVSGYKCTSKDGFVYYGTIHPKSRNNHPQIEPYSPL